MTMNLNLMNLNLADLVVVVDGNQTHLDSIVAAESVFTQVLTPSLPTAVSMVSRTATGALHGSILDKHLAFSHVVHQEARPDPIMNIT